MAPRSPKISRAPGVFALRLPSRKAIPTRRYRQHWRRCEIAESRLGPRHNQSVLALVDLCYAYQRAGHKELSLKTGEQAVSACAGGVFKQPNTS